MFQDTMRIFHGDGPAAQLENGNQKGGHYFCPSCDIHVHRADNIPYCFHVKVKSLQDIRNKIIAGKYDKKYSQEGKLKPSEKLAKKEIKEELISRHILHNVTTTKIWKIS